MSKRMKPELSSSSLKIQENRLDQSSLKRYKFTINRTNSIISSKESSGRKK